jgi:hypothetical protein
VGVEVAVHEPAPVEEEEQRRLDELGHRGRRVEAGGAVGDDEVADGADRLAAGGEPGVLEDRRATLRDRQRLRAGLAGQPLESQRQPGVGGQDLAVVHDRVTGEHPLRTLRQGERRAQTEGLEAFPH